MQYQLSVNVYLFTSFFTGKRLPVQELFTEIN